MTPRLQRLVRAAREIRDLIDDSDGVQIDGHPASWSEFNEAGRFLAAVKAFDDMFLEGEKDEQKG